MKLETQLAYDAYELMEVMMMSDLSPCYMCNNAKVDDELEDNNDLSYISVGTTEPGYQIVFCSGNGRPPRLEIEHWDDDHWSMIGVYNFLYCPNCGRKIVEYQIGARGRLISHGK